MIVSLPRCVVSLVSGLPVQVRDTVLEEDEKVKMPTSDVGKLWMVERQEKAVQNTGLEAQSVVDPANAPSILAYVHCVPIQSIQTADCLSLYLWRCAVSLGGLLLITSAIKHMFAPSTHVVLAIVAMHALIGMETLACFSLSL